MKHVFRFSTRGRRRWRLQTTWRNKCRLRPWLLESGNHNNSSHKCQLKRPKKLAAKQLLAPDKLIAVFLLSLVSSLLVASSSISGSVPATNVDCSNGRDVSCSSTSGYVSSPTGNDTQLRGNVIAANGAGLLASAGAAFDNQRGDIGSDNVGKRLVRQQVVVVHSVTSSVNKSGSPPAAVAQPLLNNSQPVSSVTPTNVRLKTMLDYDGETLTNDDDDDDDDDKDLAQVESQIDAAEPTGEPYLNWSLIENTRDAPGEELDEKQDLGQVGGHLRDAIDSTSTLSNNKPKQSNGDKLEAGEERLQTVTDVAIRKRRMSNSDVRLDKLDNRQVEAPPSQPNATKVATKIATTTEPAADQMTVSPTTLSIVLVNGTKVRSGDSKQQPDGSGRTTQESHQQESGFYYYYKNNGPPTPSERQHGFCFGHMDWPHVYAWTCTRLHRTVDLPSELKPLPNTLRLSIVDIETIAADALQPYKETLRDFSIEYAPRLHTIERNAFANLTRLRVVYIFQAPRLVSFDFAITGRHPVLAIIRIQQTGLKIWPDLSEFKQQRLLTSIDLDNNRIESLGTKPINIQAEVVNLEFNHITSIEEHTFNGSEIGALSLSGNRQLTSIHRNAFANLKNLIQLDLSSTGLTQLPTVGMHQLRVLKVQDNYALKQIPSIFVFPMLEEAQMTYSFHCCSFRYPKTHDPSAYEEHIRLQNEINAVCSKRQQGVGSSDAKSGSELGQHDRSRSRRSFELLADLDNGPVLISGSGSGDAHVGEHELASTTPSSDFEGSFFDAVRQHQLQPTTGGGAHQAPSAPHTTTVEPPPSAHDHETTTVSMHGNMSTGSGHGGSLKKQWLLQDIECGELVQKRTGYQNIVCTPTPDAFNPCEDIMGYPVLRVAVWFVVACSMFGNMSVIVVLLGIFRRLSVPKFLQLNLAIGDLFMGVYLAMLAGADIMTVGTYFNYALDWQHGLGCQLAGASSLFASQLSIFTLIVITFERYYTITYSIDLNMRLQLGWAARIMLIGWIYAFASAMLPIFANINSYSKTSICLPMRTIFKMDRIFILVLLVVDSCAFLIIFICYLRMYLLILKQKTEATLKERTVAMRMALLVITDFACWAPIIFFSSTAVFGHPLISVTNSKILIVFFYPLNSMANPFLYVLSTRQYRRDLNYVISRWHHWRKNLFKSREDKDYSFNNSNPYGKYPIAMNAHLNAVAAVTGVASHLHGYRIPIGGTGGSQDCGAPGQQVELIKFGGSCEHGDNVTRHCRHKHCSHKHKHKHHHNHHHHNNNNNNNNNCLNDKQHGRANGSVRQIAEERVACAIKLDGHKLTGRSSGAHYIIRHQILPEKCAPGVHHTAQVGRTTRMISYTGAGTSNRASRSPKREPNGASPQAKGNQQQQLHQQEQQQQQGYSTVKLGLVIDDNDRVSSLVDSQEDSAAQAGNTSEASRLALIGSEFKQTTFIVATNTEQDHKIGFKTPDVGGQRQQQLKHEPGYHQQARHCRAKDGTKSDAGSQQCLAMTRICMCGQGQNSSETNGSESRSKSANWTSRLNIRNRAGQKGDRQRKFRLSSPSKSAQTTVTTDANTSTTTSTTTRSQTEPDMETTATIETTTTTGNEDSQVCSEQDGAGCSSNGGAHLDRPKLHNHHSHHHHHHRHNHHHHHRAGHRNGRSVSRSRESCGQAGNGILVSNATLERITESSNTERSSTPKQHEHEGHRRRHRHHHHHHHHDNQQNRRRHHHRCRHERHHSSEKHDEKMDTQQAGSMELNRQNGGQASHHRRRRDHHQHRSCNPNKQHYSSATINGQDQAQTGQRLEIVESEGQSEHEDQDAKDKK